MPVPAAPQEEKHVNVAKQYGYCPALGITCPDVPSLSQGGPRARAGAGARQLKSSPIAAFNLLNSASRQITSRRGWEGLGGSRLVPASHLQVAISSLLSATPKGARGKVRPSPE